MIYRFWYHQYVFLIVLQKKTIKKIHFKRRSRRFITEDYQEDSFQKTIKKIHYRRRLKFPKEEDREDSLKKKRRSRRFPTEEKKIHYRRRFSTEK